MYYYKQKNICHPGRLTKSDKFTNLISTKIISFINKLPDRHGPWISNPIR